MISHICDKTYQCSHLPLSNVSIKRKPYHNGCIEMASPQYESSDVLQEYYYLRKTYHNGYIEIISPQCESSDLLQEP